MVTTSWVKVGIVGAAAAALFAGCNPPAARIG
jgi:hypothetical protein